MNESDSELLRELRNQRQQKKSDIDDLKKEIEELNKQILTILVANQAEEFVNDGLNTQIIQNTEAKIDWDGVKADIGLAKWKLIVREVPDKNLLAKLVSDGKIKPSALAKHQKIVNKGEPYVKVSKAAKEEDGE